MRTPPDAHLREVLAETAESLLNRHLETAQEWHPHALIPWSAAEDFPEDYEWSPEEMKICLLYTSPSPRDGLLSRMPSSA